MTQKEKEEEKILREKKIYQVYCKCGHYAYIYPMEKRNKKVCTWCGKYIYVNPKDEFKERLGKLL